MKQNESTRRLGETARFRIASILLSEISDPRLELVTVTGCQVSVDRSLCKVFVSAPKNRYDSVLEGLQSAKGRIRYLFGKGLDWRVTPELVFEIDASTDTAEQIGKALRNVPPSMAQERGEDEGSDPK